MDRLLEASHLYEVSVRKLTDMPRRGKKTVETPLSKLLLVNSVVNKIRNQFTDSCPSGSETETYSDIPCESRLMAAMTQSPSEMEVDRHEPSPLRVSAGRPKRHHSEPSLDLVIHSNPVLSEILDDSRPMAKEAELSFDMDTSEVDERSATRLTQRQCMSTNRGHATEVDSSPFWHMLRKREHSELEEKENWSLLSESKRLKTGAIKSLWGGERESLRSLQLNDTGSTEWRQKHSDHSFKPTVTELPFSLFSSVWGPGSFSLSSESGQWSSALCAY